MPGRRKNMLAARAAARVKRGYRRSAKHWYSKALPYKNNRFRSKLGHYTARTRARNYPNHNLKFRRRTTTHRYNKLMGKRLRAHILRSEFRPFSIKPTNERIPLFGVATKIHNRGQTVQMRKVISVFGIFELDDTGKSGWFWFLGDAPGHFILADPNTPAYDTCNFPALHALDAFAMTRWRNYKAWYRNIRCVEQIVNAWHPATGADTPENIETRNMNGHMLLKACTWCSKDTSQSLPDNSELDSADQIRVITAGNLRAIPEVIIRGKDLSPRNPFYSNFASIKNQVETFPENITVATPIPTEYKVTNLLWWNKTGVYNEIWGPSVTDTDPQKKGWPAGELYAKPIEGRPIVIEATKADHHMMALKPKIAANICCDQDDVQPVATSTLPYRTKAYCNMVMDWVQESTIDGYNLGG